MNEQLRPAQVDTRRPFRRLVWQYTLCFAILTALCFHWFYLTERTIIWKFDGNGQHFPALRWYVATLRGAIRGLFAGEGLRIPQWSFALGEGNDVLTSLHYYVLGDPLNLLALLCPMRYLYAAYGLLTHLRVYLAGLAFLWLLRETGKKPDLGALIAALIYVFGYWGLRNAVRHPFFLNPMIYLPLLIGGVERVLRGKPIQVLAGTVCLAGLSNFYFFFIQGVLTALYCLIRLVPMLRRDRKSALRLLGKLVGAAALGAAMAAVILVPVVRAFLSDTRIGAGNTRRLLYPLGYYAKLPEILIGPTSSYWLCVGTAAPSLLACLLLVQRRKGRGTLLCLLGLCLLFCLFPIFGQALNGFSYISNRWSFAFVLVISYVFADLWPELNALDRKTARRLVIGLVAYLGLGIVLNVQNVSLMSTALVLNAAALILVWPRRRFRAFAPWVLLILTAVNVVWNAAYRFDVLKNSDSSQTVAVADANRADETELLHASAAPDEWLRYSGRKLTVNAGLNADLSSTAYYWSLTNPGVSRFRRMMGVNELQTSTSEGYDGRSPLLVLSAVNRFVVPANDTNGLPMDCEPIRCSGKWTVAESRTTLPLSFVYDAWVGEERLEDLSFAERQELLLHAAALAEPVSALPEWNGELDTVELETELWTDDPDVTIRDGRFIVTKAGAHACLRFQGLPNSETLLEWRGLHYRGTTKYELYCGGTDVDPQDRYSAADYEALPEETRRKLWTKNRYSLADEDTFITFTTSAGRTSEVNYFTPDFNFYNGIHDFAQNLGDTAEALTEVRIQFREPGVFTFDAIKLYALPLDTIRSQVAARRSAGLANQVIADDCVSGEITLERPALLVFSIPVSDGWSATVDGAPAELRTANLKNMALLLEPGTHRVLLRYERPAGRLGLGISLAAWVLLLLLLLRDRSRPHRRG